MKTNGKTSYPLGCISSYRERPEPFTEPFLYHRIPHAYPKLGRSSLATWVFFCFSILSFFLALTRRALFKRRPKKKIQGQVLHSQRPMLKQYKQENQRKTTELFCQPLQVIHSLLSSYTAISSLNSQPQEVTGAEFPQNGCAALSK